MKSNIKPVLLVDSHVSHSPSLRKILEAWPDLAKPQREAIEAIVHDPRLWAGMVIAATKHVTQTPKGWQVPSSTGDRAYTVLLDAVPPRCNCTDNMSRKLKCKHIWAAEMARSRG